VRKGIRISPAIVCKGLLRALTIRIVRGFMWIINRINRLILVRIRVIILEKEIDKDTL